MQHGHHGRSIISWIGSALAVGGGVTAASEGRGAGAGAGIVMAVVGVVSAFMPYYFEDRKQRREERRRDLDYDTKFAEFQKNLAEAQADTKKANEDAALAVERALKAEQSKAELTERLNLIESKVDVEKGAAKARNASSDAKADVALAKADTALDAIKVLVEQGLIEDPQEASANPKVLLVEDDSGAARALTFLLSKASLTVVHCATVADALKRVHDRYDCLLVDLYLRDGTGIEVIEAFQRAQHKPRIVVTTGAKDSPLAIQAQNFKVESLLIKPIKIEDLISAIRPPAERVDGTPSNQPLGEADDNHPL